jgi:hypothetical protein
MLIKCLECGHEVSDKAQSCPHCGASVRAQVSDAGFQHRRSGLSFAKAIGLSLFGFFILGGPIISRIVTSGGAVQGPRIVGVEYEVTGSARAVSLTYENASGGTEQIDGVTLPWRLTLEARTGQFLYISAQNKGESGDVTVTIYRNESPVKSSTSKGAYSIASASFRVD